MAYIKINTKYPVYDGAPITFRAPCDCTAAEGLSVNSQNFVFKDAHNVNLKNTGNLFLKDAFVRVILDVTNSVAYLQNADTNSYLESKPTGSTTPVVVDATLSETSTNPVQNKVVTQKLRVLTESVEGIQADMPTDAERLPAVTTEDNGKVLTVNNGRWSVEEVPANGMAIVEVDILPQQQVTFSSAGVDGLYTSTWSVPDTPTFVVGKPYTVVIDGAEHYSYAVYNDEAGGGVIGNPALGFNGEDNGDWYSVGVSGENLVIYVQDESATHTMRIYRLMDAKEYIDDYIRSIIEGL